VCAAPGGQAQRCPARASLTPGPPSRFLSAHEADRAKQEAQQQQQEANDTNTEATCDSLNCGRMMTWPHRAAQACHVCAVTERARPQIVSAVNWTDPEMISAPTCGTTCRLASTCPGTLSKKSLARGSHARETLNPATVSGSRPSSASCNGQSLQRSTE